VDGETYSTLVEIARSAIAQQIDARGWGFDASQVEMLRLPKAYDLDGDGTDELCFVAGIPTYGGPAVCGLCVPAEDGGYEVRALIEFEEGFRDLFVSDINKDGTLEVVTLWQAELGLILSVHVHQWDGSTVRSLFPEAKFHQGLMYLRDLDADGVDEIVVWGGRYESNPRWGLQYFQIFVFRYDGNAYDLWLSRTTDRRYLPEGVLGQRIGVGGVPIQYERPPLLIEQRQRLEEHVRENGSADPALLEEIGGQSSLLVNEGFYDEALEIVDVVFQGMKSIEDPEARIVVAYEAWVARAFVYLWVGKYQEAIEAYRLVTNLYDSVASGRIDPQHGASRRRELAIAYYRIGEYGEALRWLSDAEAALEDVTLPEEKYLDELGRIRSASGLAHAELGEYERAKSVLREAAELHEGLSRFTQASISRTALGNSLRDEAEIRENRYDEALAAYAQALNTLDRLFEAGLQDVRFSDTQDLRDREADVYLEMGRTLVLDQKLGAGIRLLKKSLLLTSEANLAHHAAVHYLYIGGAYAGLGRTQYAERFLTKAVELADTYGTPETRWRALHKLALVQQADDRLPETLETLEKCIATIEQLRSQYLPEATKISMLATKERPYEDMIVALLSRSPLDDSGSTDAQVAEQAFGYVERTKSRVFAERLAGTAFGATGLPSSLVEEEKKLVRNLGSLQARHMAEAAPLRYDRGAEVARVENDLRRVHERISESGLRGREYVALKEASPIDYSGVRALLTRVENQSTVVHAGTAGLNFTKRVVLAEYFSTDEKTFLFIGRSDLDTPMIHEIDVGRSTLWEWRRLVFEDLTGPSDWDLDEWQTELGRFIEPITDWADVGDVIWFVPHGDLHSLPLHTLKIEDSFLIERNPVHYTPSASVMRYCEIKGSGRKETALVVGDSLGDAEPLTYAREEARMVADLFGVEPLVGNEATKQAVTDGITDTIDVLHMACHGQFTFADPRKSCVMLAPSGPDVDGAVRCVGERDLTFEEILGLDMRAELVTLSACESGVSERHPGDELIGLSRALIYAGAPSVLATLWRVNDKSTSLLMESFYKAWLGAASNPDIAMTKAKALQAAQCRVMSLPRFKHPYYWSPFALVGDWR